MTGLSRLGLNWIEKEINAKHKEEHGKSDV
jgi:hypothetical protein